MSDTLSISKCIIASDLHLMDDGALSFGLDADERLQNLIDHVKHHHSDAELLVFNGDIAEQATPAVYEKFFKAMEDVAMPTLYTLGNHDDCDVFRSVNPKVCNDKTGKFDACFELSEGVVFVLDSSHKGASYGVLTPDQIGWLEEKFSLYKDKAKLLVIHHNIFDLGIATDNIRLSNNEELVRLLNGTSTTTHVVSGHVHLPSSGTVGGVGFSTIAGSSFGAELDLRTGHNRHDFNKKFKDGPAQYGVVLVSTDNIVVHTENFVGKQSNLDAVNFPFLAGVKPG